MVLENKGGEKKGEGHQYLGENNRLSRVGRRDMHIDSISTSHHLIIIIIIVIISLESGIHVNYLRKE